VLPESLADWDRAIMTNSSTLFAKSGRRKEGGKKGEREVGREVRSTERKIESDRCATRTRHVGR
jgi:hypothetical protein